MLAVFDHLKITTLPERCLTESRYELRLTCILALLLCFFSSLRDAVAAETDQPNQRGTEYFENHIRPLLVKHCYECHSEAEGLRSGGLLLDRESGWIDGGDLGQAVVPGDVKSSLLIEAIEYNNEDLQMPPEEKLSDEQIALFTTWIKMGAPGPEVDHGETEFSQLGNQKLIFGKAVSHWAFQPVKKTIPPQVDNREWNSHPIDQFIFSKLAEQGLSPAPAAEIHHLRRRISLDLTGLPPQNSETDNIDSLIAAGLAAPHFGEHLARLWMDVVRYADTANDSVPATRPAIPQYYPYAFTYRDYIINAFNDDVPYDQFIREQLAADLLGFQQDDPRQAALGLIAVSPILNNVNDFADDVIDTVSRGFLGLTVACSRCHDHKFEPIPTADYYSMFGVFRSIERIDPDKFAQYPALARAEVPEELQKNFEEEQAIIQAKIDAAKQSGRLIGARQKEYEVLNKGEMTRLITFHPAAPSRAIVVKESKSPFSPQIFLRGEPDTRGDRVPRRFLKILDPEQTPFTAENSGRLELAEKIASADNPLTARVFVNRVWGLLMGRYLVATPSDFGLQGSPPTHPELLDWLAADFMEHHWSVKHLVKTIVTSRTYQQSSQYRAEAAAVDPENQLYHRAQLKRLTIEQLRDSVLALSGELDPRILGRSERLWESPFSRRRTLYGEINRIESDPTMRAFDFPSSIASADKRTENLVPQQSLFAMNSDFMNQQSQKLVEHLHLSTLETRTDQIEQLFRHILNRESTSVERTRMMRFVELMEKRNVDPLPLIAQSLIISNEFFYVD